MESSGRDDRSGKWVLCTPEIARETLKKNTRNRVLNKRHISMLAEQMKAGKWRKNGETIILSEDGAILDGQHRLHAIVNSGVTLELLVVGGISSDAQITIDTGKRRSAGDALSLNGERRAATVASALRWILQYKDNMQQRSNSPTPQAIAEALLEYPGVRESVEFTAPMCRRLIKPGVLAAFHYLAKQTNDAQTVDDFCLGVCQGFGLEAGSPVTVLRDRLLRMTQEKVDMQGRNVFSLVIKAWNAYVSNRTITQLSWRPTVEEFPKII